MVLKLRNIFCVLLIILLLPNCNSSSLVCNHQLFGIKNKIEKIDSVKVEGMIIEHARGYFGDMCIGGMIKVKLDYKLIEDNLDTLYIVIVNSEKNLKGKRVEVIATKLLKTDKECYYKSFIKINNEKHHFYKLSEKESGKL